MTAVSKQLRAKFTCPCCGYFGLTCLPYERMGNPLWEDHGLPPYCQTYGEASYEVCPCCGFEFGLEDEAPDSTKATSFEDYLATWISAGGRWFEPELKPENWALAAQLETARIVKPNV